jgi:hypothetical protein
MSMSIDSFKSVLKKSGARPNLFDVHLVFPEAAGGADLMRDASFLVKATSLPGFAVTPIEIPFMGRRLTVTGDRTFEDWTVTVINDENFKLRNAFEGWNNIMNDLTTATQSSNVNDYQRDAMVHQLGKDGAVIKTYTFHGIFPTGIGAIELAYDSNDSIEEFEVTFSIQYFTASGNLPAATTSGRPRGG